MPLRGVVPAWVMAIARRASFMTIARLLFVLIGQPPISAQGIALRMNSLFMAHSSNAS